MVFIGGPRQVGKTTLARDIGQSAFPPMQYLNWDEPADRQVIRNYNFDAGAKILVLDEVHKYRPWKNHIKGLYDVHKEQWKILVTGSARLDIYRRGSDSLQGRYHHYRLHPFSMVELRGVTPLNLEPFKELSFPPRQPQTREIFDSLLRYGGFPEPFLRQDEKENRRWHLARMDRLVRDDIRDLENVRDLSALHILIGLLPAKVGSLLSLNSLREDLETAHGTVAHWMDILEHMYVHYRIPPFTERAVRALRRERKLYLWDWFPVEAPGAKLENIIASHLLKFTHFLHDAEGWSAELHYLRDRAGREVDFLVTVDRKPWFAVEVKESDRTPAKTLTYYGERLNIPYLYQVIHTPGVDVITPKKIRVISADIFLSGLV